MDNELQRFAKILKRFAENNRKIQDDYTFVDLSSAKSYFYEGREDAFSNLADDLLNYDSLEDYILNHED